MIITLTNTSTREVDARLLELRTEGGVVALGRVLTLIIITPGDIEPAIEAANDASREHPCRVIVVNQSIDGDDGRLDAEIRVGADAGASDVVILHPEGPALADIDTLLTPLLLPDIPIVVWWPQDLPDKESAARLAPLSHRRITDVLETDDPIAGLHALAEAYQPGDTDLSWARTTLWRGLTAATLDTANAPVTSGVVKGNVAHPSVPLFAGWLRHSLGVPITVEDEDGATAITGVSLRQGEGDVRLSRPEGTTTLTITAPGQPDQNVSLPLRGLSECLIEDLRRLDPDETYAESLKHALEKS